ncbi:hypothetical protein CERSUDRAFT_117355 [Gelatoporia subvermispora B]|uniref:Uncharacterized protein n=1 Tax=Ceriporiopsis subvermispora (strain B) TaxID=914234 RepID=M2R763_CERS8|nr:hypothetical protein CERSUDRAFT_117355 [Gelatoporia subvermispora B]
MHDAPRCFVPNARVRVRTGPGTAGADTSRSNRKICRRTLARRRSYWTRPWELGGYRATKLDGGVGLGRRRTISTSVTPTDPSSLIHAWPYRIRYSHIEYDTHRPSLVAIAVVDRAQRRTGAHGHHTGPRSLIEGLRAGKVAPRLRLPYVRQARAGRRPCAGRAPWRGTLKWTGLRLTCLFVSSLE